MEEKSVPQPTSKKGSKKVVFMVLGCFLLISCCCVSLFLGVYFFGEVETDLSLTDITIEDINEDLSEKITELEEIAEESEESTVVFTGNHVSASVPNGWTVVEYENGSGGYGLLMDGGSYTGLTAIVLRDPQGKDVFSILGVDGIGGTDECDPIYKFTDTPQSYITQKQQEYTGLNPGQNAQVVDLGASYEEFELFGRLGRLVGADIYWNTTLTNTVFKPQCGMPIGIGQNIGLSYTFTGNAPSYFYLYQEESGLTTSNAETAIEILDSLQVVSNP